MPTSTTTQQSTTTQKSASSGTKGTQSSATPSQGVELSAAPSSQKMHASRYTPSEVMYLQRAMGNQVVQGILQRQSTDSPQEKRQATTGTEHGLPQETVSKKAIPQAKISRTPIADRIMREIAPEHQKALLDRMAALDYNMLTLVASKAPVIKEIDASPSKIIPFADREMLKQLILVSPESADKIRGYVTKALEKNNVSTLFNQLRKGKTLSSGPIYTLIAESRSIVSEGYRRGSDSEGQDFGDLITSEDAKQDSVYKAQLTHKKKRFLRKDKTVQHSFTDLLGKVRAIATLNLNDLTEAFVKGSNIPQPSGPSQDKSGIIKPSETMPQIAVAGGGPIGLMAAIEARMRGAQVTLFEGRGDEYSRRQVLVLEPATIQKFRKYGIYEELFGKEDPKGDGTKVAVMYIENALARRAQELGIETRKGWYLSGATESSPGKVDTIFQNTEEHKLFVKTFDLLIVAVGAGVAGTNKNTGVTLKDELGLEYKVQRAKDYAVTGLFKPTEEGLSPQGVEGWKYRFNTPKVTYLLHQVTPEQFEKFGGKDGDTIMQEYMKSLAKDAYERPDMELAPNKNEKGQKTPNVGRFMIQIQQAKKFVNETLSTVVIGDSAATPHPHTGSGLNTGVAELDALGDLVESLRQQKLMSLMEKRGGKPKTKDEDKSRNRSTAFDSYNTEMKGWTDKMVNKALGAMKEVYSRKVRVAVQNWEAKYAQLPIISTIVEEVAKYKSESLKIHLDKTSDRETLVNQLVDMLEEVTAKTKEYDAMLRQQQYEEYMRERVDEI